jgi:hypothetical protein
MKERILFMSSKNKVKKEKVNDDVMNTEQATETSNVDIDEASIDTDDVIEEVEGTPVEPVVEEAEEVQDVVEENHMEEVEPTEIQAQGPTKNTTDEGPTTIQLIAKNPKLAKERLLKHGVHAEVVGENTVSVNAMAIDKRDVKKIALALGLKVK